MVRRGGREKNDYLVMVIRMVWFFTGRPNLESGGCFAVHWTFVGDYYFVCKK
jgi:hypothetical protein